MVTQRWHSRPRTHIFVCSSLCFCFVVLPTFPGSFFIRLQSSKQSTENFVLETLLKSGRIFQNEKRIFRSFPLLCLKYQNKQCEWRCLHFVLSLHGWVKSYFLACILDRLNAVFIDRYSKRSNFRSRIIAGPGPVYILFHFACTSVYWMSYGRSD